MAKPGPAELREALAKARNADPAQKPKAVSDAGRLAIEVTRDVTKAAGRDTAKQFSDLYEDELRQA
ncbi:hypothetical protein ACFXGA_18760 [Actinosynnema sp. NPDC059335]|uniref:hypothetical protein n=1 Tax=Actinosynnema sp. NPDC059335 TaxID=3346804 RepID=UPI00366FBD83